MGQCVHRAGVAMTRRSTVLVLAPWLGGDYFGLLLSGVAKEVFSQKHRLIVVDTLAESAPRDVPGERAEFALPVAWSHADGVVSVTTAAGVSYLERLRDEGKPVVLLSGANTGGFEAPCAQPDNRAGATAAVEHLISHGHARIGFVGNLAQQDIRDRHEAYCETLERYGLTANPEHLFIAPETNEMTAASTVRAEAGGATAAASLLKSPHRPTALMVATDRNALGLMRALAAAGVEVPRDIAIAGFDNITSAAFSVPPLTSVNQRFDDVGALAGRLILAKMRGEEVPNVAFTSTSALLAVRESCGCDGDARQRGAGQTDECDQGPTDRLLQTLHDIFERDALTEDSDEDRRSRIDIEVTMLEAVRLLKRGDAATTAQTQSLTTSLHRLTSRPDVLRRFAEAMSTFAHRSRPSTSGAAHQAFPLSPRLGEALWRLQAGAFQREVELADAAIAEHYVVDAGLLDTTNADPRNLDWLTGTHVKMGALALWQDDPHARQLHIAGTYGMTADESDLLAGPLRAEDFPPEALLSSMTGHEVCVVIPLLTRERDWGLLALVADMGPATMRETYQHWAALLCTALESRRLQKAVQRSAHFDALTGLPNRELFVRELEHALALWQRSSTPFAVLFLDLDGFKLVNDSLGHHMGDRVLKAVGADIQRELRAVDTAARFGGDEFVILLANTDHEGALLAARRVQAALATTHHFDGQDVDTRASIGVATSAIEYACAEDVLRDADTAMYRAKETEPGTTVIFDTPMHENTLEREALSIELQLAFHDNQFEIHYQPIVNLMTGRTDRFEALTRWRHPVRGLLLPDDFLDAMEETGLVVELGHWVVGEVCRQLVEWGPEVVNVSINVSDKEFWNQDLLTSVLKTLRRYGLAPERLTLEITEAVLMRRPEVALRHMQRMHEAGLRLHIDDFGTGYSSLETLHRFPVDAFKIDRSFIHNLTTIEHSAELINSLVKLAEAIDISVVAEGVETTDQLDALREIGCATGQGYLFMPAVSGDRVKDLVKNLVRAEAPADGPP